MLNIQLFIFIIAVLSALCVGIGPSAAQNVRLTVALDVPYGQTPEIICVATPHSCTTKQCSPQVKLGTLRDQKVLVGGDTIQRRPYHFDAEKIAADRTSNSRQLAPAFDALERTPSKECTGLHEMCLPALTIPYDTARPDDDQYLTCNQPALSDTSSPTEGKRVVFLHVAFESSGTGAGIRAVALNGRVATITFNSEPTSSRITARVIGGDYAESQAIGTVKRVDIQLHPRCQAYSVLLPPRAPSVRLERKGGKAVELQIGGVSKECDVEAHSGNAFTAMIPYRDDSKEKRIRVHAATALSADPTEFEASWSTPAPPRPVQLAYREIAIAWQAHCLMAKLAKDAANLDTTKKADDGALVATASCPRITLVGAGADCTISDDRKQDEQMCRYRCRAPDTMPAFQLPSPARFARFLGSGSHLVSEWADMVEYAGQQLSSYEPSTNRSLVVSLKDRRAWGSHRGDRIYGIEIDVGGKMQRIVLSGRPEAEADSEPWFRVAAPGLNCADPVRMHVDGTREYWLRTLTTRSGVLILKEPKEYRDEIRPGSAFGVAFGPGSFAPWVSGQLAMEDYLDWPSPGAWELSFDYHVGRLGYLGVTPPDMDSTSGRIWYHRFALKAKYTWWRWPDVHLGIGAGGGFGVSILDRDQEIVGGRDWTLAVEPYVRFRSLIRRNSWVEVGIDIRMSEDRWDFETDFLSQPSRSPSRAVDGFLELRLRFGNG